MKSMPDKVSFYIPLEASGGCVKFPLEVAEQMAKSLINKVFYYEEKEYVVFLTKAYPEYIHVEAKKKEEYNV